KPALLSVKADLSGMRDNWGGSWGEGLDYDYDWYNSSGLSGSANTTMFGGAVAVGHRFAPWLRCEGEGILTTGSESVMTLTGQVYVDFPLRGTSLKPYVNVGAGNAWYKNDKPDVDANALCWSLGTGCAYALTERLSLDVSYRYFRMGDMELSLGSSRESETETSYSWSESSYSGTVKLSSHVLLAGLRYTF
ncbi:MAG: outer membrane beta-barrel protein, partial [Kiritimatiellaeota bacterium]|nr:outer membrane beta-barrel protein [Kiritimatiellota bacterium]